ncbi:hypothetical protein A2U01_0077783, partial [Trifolium medium]|nr:hypothetical protein [Trifolium medium]
NPSSIPSGNNSLSDFTYPAVELWITGAPFPENQKVKIAKTLNNLQE